jgi:hypothetical protein
MPPPLVTLTLAGLGSLPRSLVGTFFEPEAFCLKRRFSYSDHCPLIARSHALSSWEARKINISANFCAHHATKWAASRCFFGCIPISTQSRLFIPLDSGMDPPYLVVVSLYYLKKEK